jgi:hypothetical protein
MMRTARRARWPEFAWLGGMIAALGAVTVVTGTIPTTLRDFFQPGTQPLTIVDPVYSALDCSGCHSDYAESQEPWRRWSASMMAQATRDPMMWAGLAVANQDAAFAGEFCLRCHSPGGWLEGDSEPPDGSAIVNSDFEGVTCHVCHRMADPIYRPGISPAADQTILTDLSGPSGGGAGVPPTPGNGEYVIDPFDRRRGPFDLGTFYYHDWLRSPFHETSNLCATCHDVSNPVYTRQPDGTYALNQLDTPHPTQIKTDEFPVERTYSEWSRSAFAAGPIDMGGRFGGNRTAVSSCEDCHMPATTGQACALDPPVRDGDPQHNFNGGNTWVLRAVRNLYPDDQTRLTDQLVDDSIARATDMLQRASDMELSVTAGQLNVRIINQSGHKLPTGYSEGRRMWINVRFTDAGGHLLAERGAYDAATGALAAGGADTKVYEGRMGVDAAISALTGVPVGPSFHFALNNLWYSDNRIPPRGFTNTGFAAVQAAPVAYAYADGQYWDDTRFAVPAGASRATVTVYYQTTSREYIEFLRDANHTNTAGQVAYDQWVANGRSTPVVMDASLLDLPVCRADFNGDGLVNVQDFLTFLAAYAAADPRADVNADAQINLQDFLLFLSVYAAGCP